jgi:hypothetical protein
LTPKDLGDDTLDKLDVTTAHCDPIVHLVGTRAALRRRRRDPRDDSETHSLLNSVFKSTDQIAVEIKIGRPHIAPQMHGVAAARAEERRNGEAE